jgi:hypothetical protein
VIDLVLLLIRGGGVFCLASGPDFEGECAHGDGHNRDHNCEGEFFGKCGSWTVLTRPMTSLETNSRTLRRDLVYLRCSISIENVGFEMGAKPWVDPIDE